MNNPVEAFERRCADVGVKPVVAVQRAGVSQSTWFRWKANAASPTFRRIEAVNSALDVIVAERSAQSAA